MMRVYNCNFCYPIPVIEYYMCTLNLFKHGGIKLVLVLVFSKQHVYQCTCLNGLFLAVFVLFITLIESQTLLLIF